MTAKEITDYLCNCVKLAIGIMTFIGIIGIASLIIYWING